MKPARFDLHRAATLDDAVGLLREHGDEARVLAGGQSLVPMLALRLARFAHLVDVNDIAELSGIGRTGPDTMRVGAMTRQRAAEQHPEVHAGVPLLARALPHIGHFPIRNRGTIGGSLAHADPASELPAVALALDAVLITSSRSIAAADFFVGTWTTALADDELLTAIEFPVWPEPVRTAVHEVSRRAGDFALAGCAIQVAHAGNGTRGFARCGIALFGVGDTPIRAVDAERALLEGAPSDEIAGLAAGATDPADDIHATAAQRRHIVATVVRRAIEEVAR